MKIKNKMLQASLILIMTLVVIGPLIPVFVQAIAPTSWRAYGYVSSSSGGKLSGAKVQLYGYSTGSIVPESRILSQNSQHTASISGIGYWVLLRTTYTTSTGYYSVLTSAYSDKSSMKVVVSKSGYLPKTYVLSSTPGTYRKDFTLIKIPSAPTGLAWVENGIYDIAFNTPEVFIGWRVDSTPYQGYLEVKDGYGFTQTIALTQDQLKDHYLIYTPPTFLDEIQVRLKMRNYNPTYGVYSSYTYTDWKYEYLINSNSFFPIGKTMAYSDTWEQPDRGVTANLATIVMAEQTADGKLDVSVAALFFTSGQNCILPEGLRIKLLNRGGIARTDTLLGPNDIYMKGVNYQGKTLLPEGSTDGMELVNPINLENFLKSLGYIVSLGKLYFAIAYRGATIGLFSSALGLLTSGTTIWGGITIFASIAKFVWFDLPHMDSQTAIGTGNHCQTTYQTAGALTALNRPVELLAFAKFRIDPVGSVYDTSFDIIVDTNGYLRDGYGMGSWIGSNMATYTYVHL